MEQQRNRIETLEASYKKNNFSNIAPILGHLRAFEATARLGSMTLAAKELNTTVSSISRHNRLISEYLHVELFENINRSLRLTEEGYFFYRSISSSLSGILEATDYITQHNKSGSIKIYSSSIFMFRWIIPRIRAFLNKNKLESVRLFTHDASEERCSHILFSLESTSENSEVFLPDEILPVSNPNRLAVGPDAEIPLICTRPDMTDWDDWFQLIPSLQSQKTSKIFIADENAALEAACQGLGVAITRLSVAREALDTQVLSPFGNRQQKKPAFIWCTRPQGRSLNREEKQILSFLKAEAILSFKDP